MAMMKLRINQNSRNIPEDLDERIYDMSVNGIEIQSKVEDFPMPWDAVCYIDDGFFILSGDMGQQGGHRGWAKTGIPLDKVDRYVDVFVQPNGEDTEEELTELFMEYGWL